jgi:hypothetical protein
MASGFHSWGDGSSRRGGKTLAGDSRVTTWFKRLDRVLSRYHWVPSLIILIALIIVGVQAADREPPFRLLRVEPAFARPGDIVTIHADVWRDPHRRCAVDVARSMYDSLGKRSDYPVAYFSAEAVALNEASFPGRMSPSLLVPDTATPGPAVVVSSLQFRCNRTQTLWTIEASHKLPFTVLP